MLALASTSSSLTKAQGNHRLPSREHTNWNDELLQPVRHELNPLFEQIVAGIRPDLANPEGKVLNRMDYILAQLNGKLPCTAVETRSY